jgi:hypothetical protein
VIIFLTAVSAGTELAGACGAVSLAVGRKLVAAVPAAAAARRRLCENCAP